MNNKSVVFISLHSSVAYSGGRYCSWIMTEAYATLGYNVYVWTNDTPVFIPDFKDFPEHNNIKLIIDKKFNSFPEIKADIVVVIPHQGDGYFFYHKAILYARKCAAKIILLNFESPNWYNNLSTVKRPEKLWEGWLLVSKYSDMILSIAREGTKYAIEYYSRNNNISMYRDCYPAINTIVADKVKNVKKEKQIICLTRFDKSSQHKGGSELAKIFNPSMKGYTLALVVGVGGINQEQYTALAEKAKKFKISLKILKNLTDFNKFKEIKISKCMVFLSFFEGYGYPPVEAQYCNVPCIVYDLPVLREVSGDGLIYIKPGNIRQLQNEIKKVIINKKKYNLRSKIRDVASFYKFTERINALSDELLKKTNRGIDNLNCFHALTYDYLIRMNKFKPIVIKKLKKYLNILIYIVFGIILIDKSS